MDTPLNSETSNITDNISQWLGWQPSWIKNSPTPQNRQEKHSPTEEVLVKTNPQNKPQKCQRRILDNRMWKTMSIAQQDAAIEIYKSFEMMGRGLGYSSSSWEERTGSLGASNISDTHAKMINFYLEWAKKCVKRKLSHSMAIDVICLGYSCTMIDKDRRVRKGKTKENLLQCLNLYCFARGWY